MILNRNRIHRNRTSYQQTAEQSRELIDANVGTSLSGVPGRALDCILIRAK